MKRFIKLPHAVWDYHLGSGELQVYTAIASYANRFGACCVRHEVVAALCDVSVATVSRSVQQLAAKGLISVCQRYNRVGQLAANKYLLTSLRGGFTRVPAEIWGYKLPKSDFKVYLFMLRCRANNRWEAVPSLSQMISELHMSKRTVIDSINALATRLLLHKEKYRRKQDNRLGHNRYHIIIGLARQLLSTMLAKLSIGGRKERRAALSHRATRLNPFIGNEITYRIAHVVSKVKHFLHNRAFLLRSFIGTILRRQ